MLVEFDCLVYYFILIYLWIEFLFPLNPYLSFTYKYYTIIVAFTSVLKTYSEQYWEKKQQQQ